MKGLKPAGLSGPGGLLSRLPGRVIQAALEAEMTEHIGHEPGVVPVAAWRSGPLNPDYVIVYLDAMVVKVREDRRKAIKTRGHFPDELNRRRFRSSLDSWVIVSGRPSVRRCTRLGWDAHRVPS